MQAPSPPWTEPPPRGWGAAEGNGFGGRRGSSLLWQLNMGGPEGDALPPLPTVGEGASQGKGWLKIPKPQEYRVRGSVREGTAMPEGGVSWRKGRVGGWGGLRAKWMDRWSWKDWDSERTEDV